MPRIHQKKSTKGSQHWLRVLVNDRPDIFEREFLRKVKCAADTRIEWVSPLNSDEFAEYQDEAFLDQLDIGLTDYPLSRFWPKRGPVWDGLAVLKPANVPILMEAKAHIPEMYSPACAASEPSLTHIKESLAVTRKAFGSTAPYDWSGPLYQYTNRLAHLYLLNELNQVKAYLVFICFVNAEDMNGPRSAEEWEGALRLVHTILGLHDSKLSRHVIHVYVDVKELTVPERS